MDFNIVLFGKPGSGKGTISEHILKKYNYNYISTGDILRDIIKSDTDQGLLIKKIIGNGNLVPDDMVLSIVKDEIVKSKLPLIIDGFPRTTYQAVELNKLIKVGLVLFIDVSDETSIDRILNRGKNSMREDDSNIEIIMRRLNQYESESSPVIDFYKGSGILKVIDGSKSILEVLKSVDSLLGK